MTTNTLHHVSDESKYSIFNPAGTAFAANILNVQAALAAIKKQAVDGIQNADQSIIGITRYATQAEVDAGILTNVAVSPSTLKSTVTRPQATTTVVGLTRYATDPEAVTGTERNAAIVPASLKAHTNDLWTRVFAHQATESTTGVARLSTEQQAIAGTDHTTQMTPLRVKQAITDATNKFPSTPTATTGTSGTVRIATGAEVIAGTLNADIAISPLGLLSRTALTDRIGLIALATGAEVSGGTVNNKAVTPSTLLSRLAGDNRIGLVRTTRTANPGNADLTTALAVGADVLNLRGGQTVAGNTNFAGTVTAGTINASAGNIGGSRIVTQNMLSDEVPVGTMMLWPRNSEPGGAWAVCQGTASGIAFSQSSHPALWNLMNNNGSGLYGGNASRFYLPDMRGLFVRGAGKGNGIYQNGEHEGGKNKWGLGFGCSGASVGQVQPQGVRRHKHESGWGEHNQRNHARNGATMSTGHTGSNRTDWDNYKYYTNDGAEVEVPSDEFGTMNTAGLMGYENRPWNMSLHYIMKVK